MFLTPFIYAAKQNKRNSSHLQSTSSKKTKLSALIPGWFPFCRWRSWWESLKASAELRQSWGLQWAPGPVSTGHCPAPFEPVPVNQQERWQSGCHMEEEAWNPVRMAHRLAEIRLQVKPEGTARNLGNSNRLLRTFSVPLGDVQNKVVKGKVIFLEPWSGIPGFLHCSLRPRKAVTSEKWT